MEKLRGTTGFVVFVLKEVRGKRDVCEIFCFYFTSKNREKIRVEFVFGILQHIRTGGKIMRKLALFFNNETNHDVRLRMVHAFREQSKIIDRFKKEKWANQSISFIFFFFILKFQLTENVFTWILWLAQIAERMQKMPRKTTQSQVDTYLSSFWRKTDCIICLDDICQKLKEKHQIPANEQSIEEAQWLEPKTKHKANRKFFQKEIKLLGHIS